MVEGKANIYGEPSVQKKHPKIRRILSRCRSLVLFRPNHRAEQTLMGQLHQATVRSRSSFLRFTASALCYAVYAAYLTRSPRPHTCSVAWPCVRLSDCFRCRYTGKPGSSSVRSPTTSTSLGGSQLTSNWFQVCLGSDGPWLHTFCSFVLYFRPLKDVFYLFV